MNLQLPAELFEVSVGSELETEKISLWEDDKGAYYVFLPGYAQPDQVWLKPRTETQILLNGKPVYDGMSCGELEWNVSYSLEYSILGRRQNSSVTFLKSSNVATMFLDTKSGNMAFIHEKKGNEESGTLRLYREDGTMDCAALQMTVKGRGNASWNNQEKKPYTVTLSREEDFLEMGAAGKWILLANALDDSHIRNKLVYDFAAELGFPYSPESRWVDLYLNGEYAGLYLLSEKVEVHPQRVALEPDNSALMALEYENRMASQNISYVMTQKREALRIHYPEQTSEEDIERLERQWQSVENAILAEDSVDPVSGKALDEMIHTESWISHYVLDEVFGNPDGFLVSRYFYRNGSGDQKIYAGPVWDYDLAMGNNKDMWCIPNPNVLVLSRYENDDYLRCAWTQALYEQDWFRNELKQTLREKILPMENWLQDQIDAYAEQIRIPVGMDSIRWAAEGKEDFEQALSCVKTYLREHIAFLEEVWVEEKPYYQLSFLALSSGGYDQFYMVPEGGFLEEMPEMADGDQEFAGWYDSGTGELFDINRPVTLDMQFYARWNDTLANKLDNLGKLLPLGVIALLGTALLSAEVKKILRS